MRAAHHSPNLYPCGTLVLPKTLVISQGDPMFFRDGAKYLWLQGIFLGCVLLMSACGQPGGPTSGAHLQTGMESARLRGGATSSSAQFGLAVKVVDDSGNV